MRYAELTEADDPATYWQNPKNIKWAANYAKNYNFKSEAEARAWMLRKLQYFDEQSWAAVVGKNGPVINQQLADTVPLYRSGNSLKIGKRIRPKKLKWESIEIQRPSLIPLVNAGMLNPFDGYKSLGIKMLRVAIVHETERHAYTGSGTEHAQEIAYGIKENGWFKAIIVDTESTVLDGHHRLRAVRDMLKWKTIPALVVAVGEEQLDAA